MKVLKILLLITSIGVFSNCEAIDFKDSSSYLFLRGEFKVFNGIEVINTPSNLYQSTSDYYKEPLGVVLGLGYSSKVKQFKNDRWSYWCVLDFQYDRFDEGFSTITSDSPLNHDHVEIKQGYLTIQSGIKYNFKGIRPSFGYYAGRSVFSRTKGVDSVAHLFGIYKPNGTIINKLHHGIKLDLNISLYNNLEFIVGLATTFNSKVPSTSFRFNNVGPYFHVGIDYKIRK